MSIIVCLFSLGYCTVCLSQITPSEYSFGVLNFTSKYTETYHFMYLHYIYFHSNHITFELCFAMVHGVRMLSLFSLYIFSMHVFYRQLLTSSFVYLKIAVTNLSHLLCFCTNWKQTRLQKYKNYIIVIIKSIKYTCFENAFNDCYDAQRIPRMT